jgi:acyl-CoA thioester hydrolase
MATPPQAPLVLPHAGAYRHPITTRWGDNDVYGHVNNAVYYQYFDSAINAYLIREGGLDIHDGEVVGFIVHSACDYLAPVAYPADLEVRVAVEKLGRSSVTYALGLSLAGQSALCARARMVHVFVQTATGRPVAIPEGLRVALERLRASDACAQ